MSLFVLTSQHLDVVLESCSITWAAFRTEAVIRGKFGMVIFMNTLLSLIPSFKYAIGVFIFYNATSIFGKKYIK